MNTAKQNHIKDEPIFIFQIIRGGRYNSGNTQKLVNDLWLICHSTFWSDETFSEKEVARFKTLISAHLDGYKNAEEKFTELIERIIMAKDYISRRPWRYIAKPNEWLNINYRYGLAGTAAWYKRLTQERSASPSHKKELQLVAEALLDYSMNQDTDAVRAYTQILCEYGQYDLLRLYVNAILKITHSNN